MTTPDAKNVHLESTTPDAVVCRKCGKDIPEHYMLHPVCDDCWNPDDYEPASTTPVFDEQQRLKARIVELEQEVTQLKFHQCDGTGDCQP